MTARGGGRRSKGVQDASPSLFAPAEAVAAPHYLGHRTRLRERFDNAGAEALADYELLELMLFRVVPRRDTKQLAKALIERFGDFGAVIGADPEQIAKVDEAGPAVARELKIVQAAVERALRVEAKRRPVVGSWSKLVDYCRSALMHAREEQFRVLFLDVKNQIISDEVLGEGTIDQAPVYPREVIRRALTHGAAAIVLVHNHPSGDPTPSAADQAVTREVVAAAAPLGIKVHDHIVVGRHGVASLRALGLM